MKVIGYLLRKLLRVLSLMIAASLLAFFLAKISPVDPVTAYVGGDGVAGLTAEARLQLEQKWGMDKPPAEQYLSWLANLLRGDWGRSHTYNQKVLDIIGQKAMASLALMGVAWTLSGVLGFILGIAAGMNRGKWIDKLVRWYSVVLASSPAFWIGLLLLIIFGVALKWFPVGMGVPMGKAVQDISFGDRVYHLVLPALTLSLTGVANIALHTREKLVDILQSDYVLFAKARGESAWMILKRHGIRNIALPAITLQFASFSELFGGSVLAETVFTYPGLGSAVSQAGLSGDIPLLLGIVLFSVTIVFTGNFIANILYVIIDPRIKEGGAA